MNNPYNVGVGIGIFVCRDGKVIIQQRAGAHGPGTWAPPGGRMDHGETPEQTAIREIKEETDLDITNPVFLGFTNDLYEEGLHYITLWYGTSDVSGTARITEPHKCTGQSWCAPDDIPEPVFLSTIHALQDKTIRANLEPIVNISMK